MQYIEERDGAPIDLFICCGDFQVGGEGVSGLVGEVSVTGGVRQGWFNAPIITTTSNRPDPPSPPAIQSCRNEADLSCLACPPKYRAMNTFYK